ncbi:hypothetical protein BC628DRAFT_1415313 [Trametes gibbosa]|nr:hypothetical protein BC628DRAFT_1415313 [Trametes gibbosa]
MTNPNIEAFDSALKDVLKAKRLSQSKMNTLTEVALKCMDNDIQMVSILYRTHRGLSTGAKVASLYAFDALARAARNQVAKNHITGDLASGKGNCATFLLRIEGILDGLYRDLVLSGSNELKEKAKKILDIWTKQNTFSSAVLSPLYSLLKQTEKDKGAYGYPVEPDKADTNVASSMPSAPALPPTDPGPHVAVAPPVDVNAVQSTLLALLGQTTSVVNAAPAHVQTAPNTFSAPVPALDANQLALLQQLAQKAALGNAVPSQQPIPVPASVVPSLTTPNAVLVVPPVQGPAQPQPFPYRDDHYGAPASAPRTESEHDRFDGPERGYPRDSFNDPRRGFRGGARDRGRGGRGRGRWDDRDHNRERSREFSRDPRGRRSRSRSPPGRYGAPGPRDARPPYSAPPGGRRGRYPPPSQPSSHGYGPSARAEPEADKDEFGRDLRAESEPRDEERASAEAHPRRSASPLPPGTGSVTTSDRGSVASDNAPPAPGAASASPPQYQQQPYSYPNALLHDAIDPSAPASHSPSTSAVPHSSSQHRAAGATGLEAFDRTTFDPANAASWESLGRAWSATHGSLPTQEQLMQFVFTGGCLPDQAARDPHGGAVPAPPQQQQHSPSQESRQPGVYRQQSPPQPYSQQAVQAYGDDGRDGQWPDQERGWNSRPQGPRGGWRGGGGRAGFGSPGRARGRGRGEIGRGGYGRGDSGWRGAGREDRGRASYGYGNGRGAHSAGGGGFHEQETDAVMLSGGGDDYAWQEQQSQGAQPYGQLQQDYQPPAPFQSGPQTQTYGAPVQPPQGKESAVGGDGGGTGSGRMQRVGDGWVFVRGTA